MSKTLEAIISSPSLVREQWLSPELAVREVLAFERRFGSQHLMLACHAALPLILNPELLNLIHINFLEEEQIPWVAEVDFLLSPLCRSIDDGLYEVEPSIREVLLTELENQFGWERPFELAKFLQYYLDHKSDLKPRSEVTRTQRWLAQAYIAPDKVVEDLTNLLETSLSEENYLPSLPGLIQVTNTLELLAEPLERSNLTIEYRYLLNNSRVLAQILYGDEQRLKEEFREEQSEGKLGEIEAVQLLMLSTMLLAYQGVAVEELPKTNTLEEHRKHLLDAYIERMFRRRRMASQRYQKAQAMRWLVWLARRMYQESRTVFVIEQIQPFSRLQEYRNGNIPWDYARFLDYATELGFLEKVGNGYIFIHPLLLEHFAQMELD